MALSGDSASTQHKGPWFAPGAESAEEALLERLRTLAVPLDARVRRHSQVVVMLDTFDWRLLRAGVALEHRRDGGRGELELREVGKTARTAAAAIPHPPRHPNELPGAFLRRRLLRLSRERALLAMAQLRREELLCELVDAEEKVRVRFRLRRERALRSRRPARCRLLLETLTGYRREASLLRAVLRETGWRPCEDPVAEALAEGGRDPFDYPPRWQPLQADMSTRAAFGIVGLVLLGTLCRNVDGLRADLDTEFLHDFRVALRRTRTLLGELQGVLPAAAERRFRREFKWLGSLSGAARDGDVQLAEMRDIVDALPARRREALAPLFEWLREQREASRASLLRALDSARFRRLVEDWRALLRQPPPRRTRLANALRPVGEVAAERIGKAFRRVQRKGARITDASPPAELHELRKDAKRLRYVIEFFGPLYAAERVDVMVRDLKALQENLGEYQDLEVQRLLLEGFAPQAPAHTAAELDRLAAGMARREARVRDEFDDRFRCFASEAVHAHLAAMLEGGG